MTQIRRRNGEGERVRAAGVVGCGGGDGASTIASNLAVVASTSFAGKVLLIDAHLRRPSQAHIFAVDPEFGLADVLMGDVTPEAATHPTSIPSLYLLSAGSPGGIVIDEPKVEEVIDGCKKEFEQIVVDLPPVMDVDSPGSALAGVLDGVVLVLEAEKTRIQAAEAARSRLARESANVLGVVFNKRRQYVPGWIYRRL